MAFLGIKIPISTARLLAEIDIPGKKTGVHEMHITMLMFDDNWPISELAKSMEATYDIVSETKPFIVSIEEVTHFPKREDKPCAVIAPVVSNELHDLNKKLRKKFDKQDIEFDKKFKDFKPHVTLAYADEEPKKFKIDSLQFAVEEIILFGGDHGDSRIFVTMPLKGPEKKKNSSLLQKIDLFYKMAKVAPNSFMTPSYERRKTER